MAILTLVIPYLISSEAEESYLPGFLESIQAAQDLMPEVTITVLEFEGVKAKTWGDVSRRRAEIVAELPSSYDYLLFLDPDDELSPEGFAAAWRANLLGGGLGMLLLEEELGQAGFKKRRGHCCKLVVRLELLKQVAVTTLARGVKDNLHARFVCSKYSIPKTTQVAHLTRLRAPQ